MESKSPASSDPAFNGKGQLVEPPLRFSVPWNANFVLTPHPHTPSHSHFTTSLNEDVARSAATDVDAS